MRGIQLSRRADDHQRQFAADNADSNDPGHETRQMARRDAPVSSFVAFVRELETSSHRSPCGYALRSCQTRTYFPFGTITGYASDIDQKS